MLLHALVLSMLLPALVLSMLRHALGQLQLL
jgi:hypothetical protein